jgi:glycogen debranching enzyme
MCPIFLIVGCNQPADQQPPGFIKGLLSARRELRDATRDATTIETSNALLNEILCRSAADLQMLMTDTPEGRYPYAGIPWYSTTFGRDGLITAMQMLWCDPSVARGVLRRLAARQAKKTDPLSDAQPGKILHEMRAGEMAALHEVPFGLYYGSVDATPLFVLLAGLYAERTDDQETLSSLWPAIEAALGWIDGLGDPDGDGFVEYRRASDLGLANQGWKDSQDAIFHADGRLAEGDIALAEVQGYVFAAKTVMPSASPGASKRPSGAPNWAPTRWRSTAQSSRAAFARRMPDKSCSRASRRPNAPHGLVKDYWSRASFRAGAFAPWPKARRATIPCPTTTARSGRTTTR